ncbi:MAG: putative Adenylyl cyclase CyaB [Parcubacteria group bacterium]|nr:putative Adenylyl cyclase CyaB [Parcubacteria group bacterium]
MREIEIKAHLRERAVIIEKLKELGCAMGEPVAQEDIVYVKRAGSMDEFLGNDLFLRIRATKGETIFTLKYHPDRTQNGNSLSMPLEHELTVSSRPELEAMLALLGFTPALRIYKERQTSHYQKWEICLDDVEELGSFIEVEQLAEHEEDVGPVSDSLIAFLESLGVAAADIGAKRYDVQLLEKRFSAP